MARALEIADLFKVERLSKMALSPDGNFVWIITKRIDLEQNTSKAHSYLIEVKSGDIREIPLHEKNCTEIVYIPDQSGIFFAADGQVFHANPDGSDCRQITKGPGGASSLVPSSDGNRILFVRSVFMNPKTQQQWENTNKDPELAEIYGAAHPKAKVRIADKLMYRHWDSWTENKRNHLFIADVSTGEMVDLTPDDADVPPIALDSGRDIAFSPDGKRIVFVKNPDNFIARSTNNSIYLMEIDGLKPGKIQRISDTDGCDTSPHFLSDRRIGYCSMLTPGYEADAIRYKVYDIETGQTSLYLKNFDRSIEAPQPVSEHQVLFLSQDFSHISLYLLDLANNFVSQLTSGHTYTRMAASKDGSRILAFSESMNCPSELVELSKLSAFSPCTDMGHETRSSEIIRRLTHFGDVLDDIDMDPGRIVHYDYKGQTLEGWVVFPPDFDETKRYPLILLIHGGPQGAFLDQFHYRWNTELFASQGAVVAFCNPHGSTGYGHELTRSISRHWSDDCPKAIMAFVDDILKKFPQIDPDRMAAAGASFGGFMINWLMGNTDRFKAFVSHDGIFNTEMSGYITDELWFCDYEFGGAPYDKPADYQRHSPHQFVKNFKTPTLVVQGEQDFRCFISEGVGLFTALQYMGVESRLVYFPTEGHWVLEPADSFVWYHEVLSWLMNHIS